MGAAYPKSAEVSKFDSSREQFKRIVSMLQDDETLRLSEDAVEQLLTDEGRELQRRLLQDHLNLRAAAQVRLRLVEDADDVAHNEARPLDRQLCSVFGGVTVWRLAYQCPGTPCLCPLDGALSLPSGLHSYGIRRLVALHAAKESFDDVISDIEERTGVRVHKRQAEQVAQASAVDFERYYVLGPVDPSTVSQTAHIVLNFDGKGIIMREQDLRELTPGQVAAGMRRSATLQKLTKKKREGADTCARYLIRKRKLLNYAQALRQGYPIATGVVEGACRHLIARRMDVSGAPWSLAGAEAIVKLRALWMTGDFEQYWQYHLSKEKERNHLARYLDGVIPDPLPAVASKSMKLRRIK